MPTQGQFQARLSSIGVSITGATQHAITNLAVPTANTEVSHALSTDVKQVIIRCREYADIKIALTAAESGTKYFTIRRGCVLGLADIAFSAETLYVQSPVASVTVEILELF